MFLKEYFKKRDERKAEEANRKIAEQALLEQKEKYWELCRALYRTIMFINKQMDDSLPLEYSSNKVDGWPELGTWSLKLDDKLTIEIKVLCPEEITVMAYEAIFIIDGIPINVDLTTDWVPEFGKLGKIVCDELEKRVKEYSEKKKSVVDDYIKWKEETNDSLDSDIQLD